AVAQVRQGVGHGGVRGADGQARPRAARRRRGRAARLNARGRAVPASGARSAGGGARGMAAMATALIVEDHADQAEMVARMLKLGNYDPVVAGDGTTGLELAGKIAPDVVLLDLMLPDIDGFEVCRRLRTDRATMLTPIVMLTARHDAEYRVRGFRVGANAY